MFKDVKMGSWYYNLIDRLSKMQAVAGTGNDSFEPERPVTRAEAAAMIDKYNRRHGSLISTVLPSVVMVQAVLPNGKTSLGSGVILDKEGHIATNCHVIADGMDISDDVKVGIYKMPFVVPAKTKYGQFGQDVAILKIQADKNLLQPVSMAQNVVLAEEVYCVGMPLGYNHSVSRGIVSYEKRKIGVNEWIQTDCSINPGNSGGGAFNSLGEFIGLPTFKMCYADSEKTIPVDNIGFISPWHHVQCVYEDVIKGYVGYTGQLDDVFIVNC